MVRDSRDNPSTTVGTTDRDEFDGSLSFFRRRFIQALSAVGIGGFTGNAAGAATDDLTQRDALGPRELLVTDVEANSYWERLMFTCLQGLVNRDTPEMFLTGLKKGQSPWYDQFEFLPPENNIMLEWYEQYENLSFRELTDPYMLFNELTLDSIDGYVLVDTTAPVTVNIAANYASIEDLLPVTEGILQHDSMPDFNVKHDLRGEFTPGDGSSSVNFGKMNKVGVYEWAIEHQWPEANHAVTAELSTPVAQTGNTPPLDITAYTENSDTIYVKFEDSSPENGWGAQLRQLQIADGEDPIVDFQPTTEAEQQYIYENSGTNTNDNKKIRWAPSESYWIYKLSGVQGADGLGLNIWNEYLVSIATNPEGPYDQLIEADQRQTGNTYGIRTTIPSTNASVDSVQSASSSDKQKNKTFGAPTVISPTDVDVNSDDEAEVQTLGNETTDVREVPGITIYTANGIRDYAIAERGFFFELSSNPKDEAERALKSQLLAEMDQFGYVLGWHVARDSEDDHISHLTEYGQLALGGTTFAMNFSMHSRVEIPGDPIKRFKKHAERSKTVDGVDDSIYLTFVMSDGDSLNHVMRNAHGGQWLFDQRGEIPFGWEMQPLLADIGPGILDYFQATATDNDHFVASASGIGYIFPSQMPEGTFEEYLKATNSYIQTTGMSSLSVLNNYQPVSDEKKSMYVDALGDDISGIIQGYTRAPGIEWLNNEDSPSNYAGPPDHAEGRLPARTGDGTAWLSTVLPDDHQDPVDKLVNTLNTLAERRSARPLFVPIHVPRSYFTYPELVDFVDRLDSDAFEVTGPDEFFTLCDHERPHTVIVEPPEGIPPNLSYSYVSGETNTLTMTLLGFGTGSIPVDIQAKISVDGLDTPVTAETATKIEPGVSKEVPLKIDIPEAAGEGTGQLEYTVDDGTPSTVTMPIQFIMLEDGESFDPPYPLSALPSCYEIVLKEEEDLVPDTYGMNRSVRTADLSSFLETDPDAIYLRFDDTDTKDPGGTDLYKLTLTADGETVVDFTPGTDAETPYLYEADGSGSSLNSNVGSYHRYADAEDYWIYEFSIPSGTDSLTAAFDVRNEFLISASTTPSC